MDQFDIINEVAERYDYQEWNYNELNKIDREKEKEEKRKKRIDDCGSWSYWFDPHTGKRQSYVFRCQMFRECEVCLRERAEQEQERLQDKMIDDKPMRWSIVQDGEIKKVLRNTGAKKEDYVCYPLKDGTHLLITSGLDISCSETVTFSWITKQDWTNISDTPIGRNKSGTLTVPPVPEDEEESSIVEIEMFITNASSTLVNTIMDEIVEETFDMNPETVEDVERCLTIRTSKVTKQLKDLGHSVTIYYRNFKVIHSDISWSFNSVNTKNFTNKQTLKHDPVPI